MSFPLKYISQRSTKPFCDWQISYWGKNSCKKGREEQDANRKKRGGGRNEQKSGIECLALNRPTTTTLPLNLTNPFLSLISLLQSILAFVPVQKYSRSWFFFRRVKKKCWLFVNYGLLLYGFLNARYVYQKQIGRTDTKKIVRIYRRVLCTYSSASKRVFAIQKRKEDIPRGEIARIGRLFDLKNGFGF